MKAILALLLIFISTIILKAETYVVKLSELDFQKDSKDISAELKKQRSYSNWQIRSGSLVSVRTPVDIKGYVAPKLESEPENRLNVRTEIGDILVAFETPNNEPFSGYLDISSNSFRDAKVTSHRFSFAPNKHQVSDKKSFEAIKKLHFHLLSLTQDLGKPWFHHQSEGHPLIDRVGRNDRFNRTEFSFYTGGRAISDNLALDRALRLMGNSTDATIDVSTLKGITVKEIDWKPLMPKEEVAIDPLAMLIPEDQHVLICPSLSEMDKIVDLLEKEGSPLAQSFTVRNPFRTLPQRYKQQLGIDFPPALASLLPIKSVAITGYDPFYPTGTDVAILFETNKADALFKMLDKTIKAPKKNLAVVGDVVVLSNSKKQLERIQSVQVGNTVSLGSLDEYKFFRHRYPTTDNSTGYVFLSDACIRRWGGPHMRIAASRRTKAIAALNNLTARQISFSSEGALLIDNEKLRDSYAFLLGKVTNDKGLIKSEKMGDLHWLTPTIEMDLDKVTKAEAEAYLEWRRGYEEGWAKVFDPIGFSFSLNDDTKELDLTVMPLSMNNDYQEFMSLAGKSLLSSNARISPENNIMTASFALDKDGEMLAGLDRDMVSMLPGLKVKPLSWLGQSMTLFAERDKHWAIMGDSNSGLDFDDILLGAPMGIRIEHTSKLKLAMFLTALKTTIQSAAPDAVKWETKEHGETKYVVLTSNEFGLEKELKICYGISKNAITFTLREDVLKRAIDRELIDIQPKLNPVQQQADHFYLNADSLFLMGISQTSVSESRRQQSYRAITILNEWHKLWVEKDPIKEHFQRFGEDIYCPGGKGYQWNAEEMTMESLAYGHPAKPRAVADDNSLLSPFGHIESAMKFEHDGLRVKLKLTKKE